MLVHDYDDERTLDEEEAMSNEESVANELDDLQKVRIFCVLPYGNWLCAGYQYINALFASLYIFFSLKDVMFFALFDCPSSELLRSYGCWKEKFWKQAAEY